jgi:hypothetical protein
MAAQTVAELTIDEFRALIRETVAEVVAELLGDPDEGLEFRDEFVAEMEKRLASDGLTIPLSEVAQRLSFPT